ncbi:acyl-CoA dehydrogenase family protein [Salinicoccus sp. Marseille-QA3877]
MKELPLIIRDFVRNSVKKQAAAHDLEDTYPQEIVDEMKEIGLFGLTIPKKYGGMEISKMTYIKVIEELAYGWGSVPAFINSHLIVAKLIEIYGTEQQKDILHKMSKGEYRGAILLTEPQAGTDLSNVQTIVKEGESTLSGEKTMITNGRTATHYAVLAKDKHGISIYLVPTDREGITPGPNMGKMGIRGIETVEVSFDGVPISEDDILGEAGRGIQNFLRSLEFGRLSLAATSVGLAQAAYDDALEYAKEREAYGRPISEMQTVQLHLADMYTNIQAARALTKQAAEQEGNSDIITSAAKYFASEVVVDVTVTSLRVLGGYGYLKDYPTERYIRDSMMYLVGEGANDALKTSIAKKLVKRS